MMERLVEILRDLCEKWNCEFIDANGEPNHCHLLFRYYPQMQLSKFIANIKSVSSRRLRAEFPEIVNSRYWKNVLWNEGYAIDAVGSVKLEVLKQYVADQPTKLLDEVTQKYQSEF
jgi:putative transposase